MEKDNTLYNLKDFIIKSSELVRNNKDNFAMVAVDVSNFKFLNDMYGMEEGDNVIRMLAEMFFINNPRCVMACNVVGDQFRALLRVGDMTIEEEVELITKSNEEVEVLLAEKYPKVFLHIYTGLYFLNGEGYKEDNYSTRTSIDKAHFAKKQAKGNFDIKCNVYSEKESVDFSKQMNVIKSFEYACVNDGIVVYYQPKMDSINDTIVGAEALCRILDENNKIISPALFIPILENNGMLSKLDATVMEIAFKDIRRWLDEGKKVVPISINVSRVDFYNPDLFEQVVKLQKEYDIPKELVELEVTETTFVENMNMVNEIIKRFREYGFKIDVDDFGSGYSSLGQLVDINADIIKLDRSFVSTGLKSERGAIIIESVIDMLKKAGFEVVCEGVETLEEKNIIRSFGCNHIQGYFYDKPLDKIEFEKKYL